MLNKYQKKSGRLRECHCHHPGRGSRTAAPRTAPSVCSAAHQCAPRRRPATLAASHRTSSSTLKDRKVPPERYFHALLTGEKSPANCFHSGRDSQVSMSEASCRKRISSPGLWPRGASYPRAAPSSVQSAPSIAEHRRAAPSSAANALQAGEASWHGTINLQPQGTPRLDRQEAGALAERPP